MTTSIPQEKVAQAKEILKEKGIDCWVTFTRESDMSGEPCLDLILDSNVTWLSAFLVFSSGKSVAIVGKGDVQAVKVIGSFDEVIGYTQGMRDSLLEVLKRFDPETIALNYSRDNVSSDGLTHGMYLLFTEMLSGTPFRDRLISSDPLVLPLRGRKTEAEVKALRRAVEMTEKILDEVPANIKPGMSEREIFNWVKERMHYYGVEPSWDPQYDPGVYCGPDSPLGHCFPDENILLEKGQTLVLDFGLKVDGYSSDLQRTWYVLQDNETQAPAEIQKTFQDMLAILEAGEKVIKPGIKAYEVDTVMRQVISKRGYGEWEYGMGHEIGRSAHDGSITLGPQWERYGESVKIPLEEGNCFAVECGIKMEGVGFFHFEQDIRVTQGGMEYLSTKQEELFYIGR